MKNIILALLLSISYAYSADTIINATVPWNDHNGMTPVVLEITSPKEQKIELTIKSNEGTLYGSIISVPARKSYKTILLPPFSKHSFYNVKLKYRPNIGKEKEIGINYSNEPTFSILLDKKQKVKKTDLEKKIESKKSKSHAYYGAVLLDNQLETNQLPNKWQAYPLSMSIILDKETEDELSISQKKALSIWTKIGGQLIVLDKIQKNNWESSVYINPTETNDLATAVYSHFSKTIESPKKTYLTKSPNAILFTILVFIFAVVVGPFNFMYCKRKKKKYLILITTPIIAFIVSVVLFISSLLAEGITPTRTITQLLHIDTKNHKQITYTHGNYYAPLSINNINLLSTQKIIPMNERDYDSYYYNRADALSNLSLSPANDGYKISGSLIKSRIHRSFSFISYESTRQRIEIQENKDGTLSIINGLNADILEFYFVDEENKIYTINRPCYKGKIIQLTNSTTRNYIKKIKLDNNITLSAKKKWDDWNKINYFHAKLSGNTGKIAGFDTEDTKPPLVLMVGDLTSVKSSNGEIK